MVRGMVRGTGAIAGEVFEGGRVGVYDCVVIGAGQAGLAASYELGRRGIGHVVLDAGRAPGGAWGERWDALTMADVHGVADLPGSQAPPRSAERANVVIPAYFDAYEREHALPVVRPVAVDRVEDQGRVLVVTGSRPTSVSGAVVDTRAEWRARTLINATGTWTRPFVPAVPGIADFGGVQVHTATYPGAELFAGARTAVVGAGASAVQFIGELHDVADLVWAVRTPPRWQGGDPRSALIGRGSRAGLAPEAGLAAVTQVEARVRAGLPPASVVSVTGLMLREQERGALEAGAYDHPRGMFSRIEPEGVRWADGTFAPVDAIVWATGFRAAVGHLAPLRLRSAGGGIALVPVEGNVQGATRTVADPRVNLVGYGPSASTIGAGRVARTAARSVAAYLAASEGARG